LAAELDITPGYRKDNNLLSIYSNQLRVHSLTETVPAVVSMMKAATKVPKLPGGGMKGHRDKYWAKLTDVESFDWCLKILVMNGYKINPDQN
jgi:hypothetical protein